MFSKRSVLLTLLSCVCSSAQPPPIMQQDVLAANGICSQSLVSYSYPGTDLTLNYVVTTSPSVLDTGAFFHGEVIYGGQGYVAFGVSPTGFMEDSLAIIGLPGQGVSKYNVTGRSTSFITELDQSEQTLLDTSIEQNSTHTVLKFSKFVQEPNEITSISLTNPNFFIVAAGNNNNEISYHGRSNRGSFQFQAPTPCITNVQFGSNIMPSSSSNNVTRPPSASRPTITPGLANVWLRGTSQPTSMPTNTPTTSAPTTEPTSAPSLRGTEQPTSSPTTGQPTGSPIMLSTAQPTLSPTMQPSDQPTPDVLRVGDVVTVEGYIMDYFCIQRGTLLDNRGVRTLEEPERHSFHCLLDVDICYESPFEVLLDPEVPGELYTRGYRLDEDSQEFVIDFGRSLGSESGCSTCTGENGNGRSGLRLEMQAEIVELESFDNGGARTPPIINVLSAEDRT